MHGRGYVMETSVVWDVWCGVYECIVWDIECAVGMCGRDVWC